jgi:hypothetical protein
MLLSNNPRFIQEYKDLSEKISKISNEDKKNELNDLLKKLVAEVKAIDADHQQLAFSPKLSTDAVERKQNLITIRKNLFDKVKDCERAGLITK